MGSIRTCRLRLLVLVSRTLSLVDLLQFYLVGSSEENVLQRPYLSTERSRVCNVIIEALEIPAFC